jgi:hypothetical protein
MLDCLFTYEFEDTMFQYKAPNKALEEGFPTENIQLEMRVLELKTPSLSCWDGMQRDDMTMATIIGWGRNSPHF